MRLDAYLIPAFGMGLALVAAGFGINLLNVLAITHRSGRYAMRASLDIMSTSGLAATALQTRSKR